MADGHPPTRRRASPEARRRYNMKFRYGITQDQHDRMYNDQLGLCAICCCPPANPQDPLAIDHSHASGAVRGLLCANCNLGLGHFRDSPAILNSAIAYLERNTNNPGGPSCPYSSASAPS